MIGEASSVRDERSGSGEVVLSFFLPSFFGLHLGCLRAFGER